MDVKNPAHLNSRQAGNDGVLEYWGKSMEPWSNGIAVPRGVNVEQGRGGPGASSPAVDKPRLSLN